MIWPARPGVINVTHYARPLYGPAWLICICIGTDHRVLRSRTSFGNEQAHVRIASIQPLPFSSWASGAGPGRSLRRLYTSRRTIILVEKGGSVVTNDTEESKFATGNGVFESPVTARSEGWVSPLSNRGRRRFGRCRRSYAQAAARNRVGVYSRPV